MPKTLAFDIYGTLFDTHGLVRELQAIPSISYQAHEFSTKWRDKQLEYSFRRGLMQSYVPFSECTSQALDYVAEYFACKLTAEEKQNLLQSYARLPVFTDVVPSLRGLQELGYRIFAFSNGSAEAVHKLLKQAKIDGFFDGVVSVETLQTFKPQPSVYHLLLQQANASLEDAWLISGNAFDILGAISVGMHTAWLKRSVKQVFDPWGQEPEICIHSLLDLHLAIESYSENKNAG